MDVDDEPSHASAALFEKYSLSKKEGIRSLRKTSKILLDLLKTQAAVAAEFSDELEKYAAALFGDESIDIFYLQVVAVMSTSSVVEFILSLIQHLKKPHQLEIRCALLSTIPKVHPNIIHESEEFVTRLTEVATDLLENLTFDNAKVFATQFYPLILSSEKRGIASTFITRRLPDCISFYLRGILKGSTSDVFDIFPEEVWASTFQILKEVAKMENIVLPQFWDFSRAGLHELQAWWSGYQKMMQRNSDEALLLSSIIFWVYLLAKYSELKDSSDVPERRPFLIAQPNWNSKKRTQTSTSGWTKSDFLEADLSDLFRLLNDVYVYLEDQSHREKVKSFFKKFVDGLKLENSPIFLTFSGDTSVARDELDLRYGKPLGTPDWLKLQLRMQKICLESRTCGLSLDDVISVAKNLHFRRNFCPSRSSHKLSHSYISDDFEILQQLCTCLVIHLRNIPLTNASDELLITSIVLVQPIISAQVDFLTFLISAISGRPKFIFKKFFDYVASLEVISEFAGISTNVDLELTPEPLVGIISVHKTRGANRGTNQALQMELQRHAMNNASEINCFESVRKFLIEERAMIARTLATGNEGLLHPAVLNSRGRFPVK